MLCGGRRRVPARRGRNDRSHDRAPSGRRRKARPRSATVWHRVVLIRHDGHCRRPPSGLVWRFDVHVGRRLSPSHSFARCRMRVHAAIRRGASWCGFRMAAAAVASVQHGGDLVAACSALATRLICRLLGVPDADVEVFRQWAEDLSPVFFVMTPDQIEATTRAITDLQTYVDGLTARHAEDPGSDL